MGSSAFALALLLALLAAPAALAQDYFYLYLRWPGGVCSKGECCFSDKYPRQNDFLVGYLARNFNAGSPPVCNPTPFNISAIRSIVSNLYVHWPSLSCPANDGYRDWQPAWEDNGICTGLDQFSYFSKALQLRQSLNIIDKLASKGIVPSQHNSYRLTDVQNAINDAFRGVKTATIFCASNSSAIIRQVRLCIDKTASSAIACPQQRPNVCAQSVKLLPLSYNILAEEKLADVM